MCSIWAKETIRASRGWSCRALDTAGEEDNVWKHFFCESPAPDRRGRRDYVALLCRGPAEAGCSKSVIMYNASWCPYCGQVRAILARNHIRYAVLDATTPQVQAIMLKRFGDTAVTRTLIGGVLVEGVDEARIKQLCR